MIHPVVEHLKARAGRSVPCNDGRKISMILLGGLMSAVRGAGAVAALEEMGLASAFDEIYSVSAGFPNAGYFLTQNTHLGISIYYEDMCAPDFINLKRVWNMVDIEYVLNVIEHVKPLDFNKLSQSPTKLFAKLLNLDNGLQEYVAINGKSEEEIKKVMRAAGSLPYLNPGAIEVDGQRYKDAGRESDRWVSDVNHALTSDATDIVVVYNSFDQYEGVRKTGVLESDRLLQIVPPDEEELLLALCTNPKTIKEKALEMGQITKSEFGLEGGIAI